MESVQELMSMLLNVWNGQMLGMQDFLKALGVFIAFAFLRGLFSRFVIARLKKFTAQTETQVDDVIFGALQRPLEFFVLIIGFFFAIQILPLDGMMREIANNLIESMVAVSFFWVLYGLVDPARVGLAKMDHILTQEIVDWFAAVVHWSVIAIGMATVLQIWGIQIAPIIAGFGLFGVAVALGAQDLFKNLLAGLSILMEQRFRVGDWVAVDGVVEGVVEQIGFRSTRVRRFDKAPVTVPNNLFSDHAVTNFSAMTNRRIYWRVGVVYATGVEQLQAIQTDIKNWLETHPSFVDPPELPCHIYIDGLGDSSIDIMVYCFTTTTDWGAWLQLKQELAFAILQIVERHGSSMAFPSRSLYIESGGGQIEDVVG
jgi:MscS family membrane protein